MANGDVSLRLFRFGLILTVSVRAAARRSKDGPQTRRLLALAAIYDGATRTQAAAHGGVTLQIVRDWVVKFNAKSPPGLIDRKAPGQPSRLNARHRAALAAIVERGSHECKFGRSVDGDEEVELAFCGSHLGDVDMEVADRIDPKLAPGRLVAIDVGQP